MDGSAKKSPKQYINALEIYAKHFMKQLSHALRGTTLSFRVTSSLIISR